MNDQFQTIDQIKATAIDMLLKFGPKVLVATAIMVAGHFVGRWLGRMFEQLLVRFKLEAPVRSLLVRVAYLIVLVLFAIMALQNLGVELLPLIAGLGVAGAGIALAMQGVLGNIVAGHPAPGQCNARARYTGLRRSAAITPPRVLRRHDLAPASGRPHVPATGTCRPSSNAPAVARTLPATL